MLDVAYVEAVESIAGGLVTLEEAREAVDRVLGDIQPGVPVRTVDRDQWLRGRDAQTGQNAMFDLIRTAKGG